MTNATSRSPASCATETEKAFLIHDGAKEIWLPKSMVEFELDKPGSPIGTATMPEWFAQEKGLI